MPTVGQFLPDTLTDYGTYEVSLDGVVARLKDGEWSLPESYAPVAEYDKSGQLVGHTPGAKTAPGSLVRDDKRRGFWLVPARVRAVFDRQWAAENEEG